jgi:hypothetical protein
MGKKKHKLTSRDVFAMSDSLLRSSIGDTLYPFCKLDNSAYYSYRKGKGLLYKELLTSEKLHKHFQKAYMRYQFLMPYGECALYDTVSGMIDIELEKQDTLLVITKTPDIGFIPEIAVTQQPCPFIDKKTAIDIALKDTLILGTSLPNALLKYIPETKTFSWVVISLMWKENDFHDTSEAEKDIVFIDAISGAVQKHKKVAYHDIGAIIH